MQTVTVLLPLILIAFAAFFKAASDTMAHHYDTSVFNRWPRNFWDASVSWQFGKLVPGTAYRIDGWHLSNSAMIIAFCLATVVHQKTMFWFYELPIAGLVFNLAFNLFYNHVLRRIP